MSTDPLAILDTPKPKVEEEELPFTDTLEDDLNALIDHDHLVTEAFEDCTAAAEKAEEVFERMTVVKCVSCEEYFKADSSLLKDVTVEEMGDTFSMKMCESCVSGVERRSRTHVIEFTLQDFKWDSSASKLFFDPTWADYTVSDHVSDHANTTAPLLTNTAS